jgi:DNA-binding HxlR family transcriptional regulator
MINDLSGLGPDKLQIPLRASLGTLGRKWSLAILRDIALLPMPTFGDLMERNPGLTPRVLSMRLRALVRDGTVERVADAHDQRKVHYRLTADGVDVVPVLAAFLAYAARRVARQSPVASRPRPARRSNRTVGPEALDGVAQFVPPGRWE